MKKLFYMGMGLLLCLSAAVFAGCEKNPVEEHRRDAALSGIITDKDTGEPIWAIVMLQGYHQDEDEWHDWIRTTCDVDGRYSFDNLSPNTCRLYVTSKGYADFLSDEISVKSGQTTQLDIRLEKLAPALRIVNDKEEDIDELDFGAEDETVTRSFHLLNDGMQALQWQMTTEADWITEVSMENGTLQPEATQSVSITIDRSKLSEGDNVTTVNIQSNAGSCQLKVKAKGWFPTPDGTYVTIPELRLMVLENDLPLGEYAWDDAKSACEQLTIGGYTDWRLPTISELAALCERKSEIGGLMQDVYWTGSKREGYDSGFHQLVNFEDVEDCFQGWARDDYKYHVRAVRTITE